MTTPPAFFFDLDGTLTDPKPGITGCIQYALERLGAPVPSKDELEWCIGPPLLANFEQLVGPLQASRGVELYRERFGNIGLFENEVYAGIPDVLTKLGNAGARLFVASSKPKVYVDRILDHFDLSQHFETIYGSELDGTRTDKRALLAYALTETNLPPQTTTMIGDRGADTTGALYNKMNFLGVLYGYGSKEELSNAGTTIFAQTPTDLPTHLRPQKPQMTE